MKKCLAQFSWLSLFILFLFYAYPSWASFSLPAWFASSETQEGRGYTPWSWSAFSLASTVQDESDKGGGRLSTYNYLSANYRLPRGRKVSLRLPWTYSTAGYDSYSERRQDSEWLFQDPFVSYTIYNLALLPLDIGVFWEGRVYVPMSQWSQDTGMRARFRSDMYFSKLLSPHWEVEYVTKLNYYAQSQSVTGHVGVDGSTGRERAYIYNTKKMYLDHWISIWYKWDARRGLGFKLGGEDTWYNESDALSRDGKREIKFGPQLRWSLSHKANFILSLEQTVGRRKSNPRERSQVQWVLLSFLRF